MGAWGDIAAEINATAAMLGNVAAACDSVLKKYITQLSQKRNRPLILYASKWTQPSPAGPIPPDMVSITDEDLQALMTVMNNLQGTSLDLILHSPGGSIEAAEAFVTYLRSKFTDDICVFVPQQAMSAATMIACAANTIVLGKHSFLGPTDPQFIFATELGTRVLTAQNIEEQFERAQKECADPSKIGAWIPILKQYGPDVLQKCRNASNLSRSLVAGWLEQYMFKGEDDANKKAGEIADWISSHKHFKTHGRHLSRTELRAKGMNKITDLEADPDLQDLVLSIFHATTITFERTPAVKIVENQLGKAFVKMLQAQAPMMIMPQMMMPQQVIRPQPMPIPTRPAPTHTPTPTPAPALPAPPAPPNPANAPPPQP
jgi:hypothetical protein